MLDIARDRELLFLGTRLRRLAEQMQGDVTLVAQRAGIVLQPGQYPILAMVEANGPTAIGELSRRLGLSQPAATKAVDRLVASGLAARSGGAGDRRERRVGLTEAGRALLERSRREIWPLVETAVGETLAGLSGGFLEQIAAIEGRLAARSLQSRADGVGVPLVPAEAADLPEVAALMNRAYRGRDGVRGWTHEAETLDGDRTSVAMLADDLARAPRRLLLWRREGDGRLLGCVWIEPEGEGTWYLGSLTVDPAEQNARLGRRLLAAAESRIEAGGGREIRMTVVNVREALIAWYERRGYRLTGETEPFPYDDPRFGVPKRPDLAFVVLRKRLG